MEKKSKNQNLNKANKAKNDEFYTQISDIEKELGHYKQHFKWKTIFCNCDDPEESNFFRYFALNFQHLWLKKLISTHFETEKSSYKLEITKWLDLNNDFKIDFKDVVKIHLKQNWDFRSPECIEILKESDIVITNPPFSLFREYISQLMEYNKKFLIVWNDNAITYKWIFNLIKENKVWLGYWKVKEFKQPNWNIQKFWNVGWYTNLETTKRNEELILYKNYNENEYKIYDNYDAIEVSKVKDIPIDYSWIMWVPITFLNNYNPNQFELLWSNRDVEQDCNLVYWRSSYINWKETFKRLFIKNKKFNP